MMYVWPPCGRARWGVVQPVGHLTVNEDGEGSNPSAPANFSIKPERYFLNACVSTYKESHLALGLVVLTYFRSDFF